MRDVRIHPFSLLLGAGLVGLVSWAQSPALPHPALELGDMLDHVSIVYLDDGQGGLAKTVRFSGVNLQVVNGLGATNGYPVDPGTTRASLTRTNGVGNLIVGYAEHGRVFDRTGSHNVAGGAFCDWSSFGGAVLGTENAISAPWASVAGGRGGVASGTSATVVGGFSNVARGDGALAAGGQQNHALAGFSAVLGGTFNVADAAGALAAGGLLNRASGQSAVALGGLRNAALGQTATTSGGADNVASGSSAAVGGGSQRGAPGLHDWAAGALFEDR
jgi:hypothetical protein